MAIATTLGDTAVMTTATSPAIGMINRYNASSSALTVALPALSPLNVGASLGLQKDASDTSANTVTVNCAGSDTLDSGNTAVVLKLTGEIRKLQVVSIAGTKYWKAIDGLNPLSSLDARFLGINNAPGADQLTKSVSTIPRWAASQDVAWGSGNLGLWYFTADKNITVSNLTATTAGTAAAATPTLCRMAIYSIDAYGFLTLLSATPNDTTLFAATNTAYTRALAAPVVLTAGTRYAMGLLVVTSAATPTFWGMTNQVTTEFRYATPRLCGAAFSLTDIPSTVSPLSIGNSVTEIYMRAGAFVPTGPPSGTNSFDSAPIASQLIFDDFVGAAGTPPDSSLWLLDNTNNGGIQVYDPHSVFLDGAGHLVLQATHSGSVFTSGRVTSRTKFNMQYGRVSASIKMVSGQGFHTGFWLLGYQTPNNYPEIDIIETINIPTTYNTTLHPNGPGGYNTEGTVSGAITDLSAGFHEYWLEWAPNTITTGIDSTTWHTWTSTTLVGGHTWTFNAPMYVTMNLEIGGVGSWEGATDGTTPFPSQMLIDWFRYDPAG